jgi:hypothetical protein
VVRGIRRGAGREAVPGSGGSGEDLVAHATCLDEKRPRCGRFLSGRLIA